MTTPHPKADLLLAIADGRQMQRHNPAREHWQPEWGDCDATTALMLIAGGHESSVRIKPATVEPTLAEFEQWLCARRYATDGQHQINIDSALFALWDFRDEVK